jgi:7-cyano-7-deazaguanine synthase in queuosine biosynthesis
MSRCIKCVIPKTAKGITFNDDGVCSLCQHFRPTEVLGLDALRQEIKKYISTGSQYDCIVPVSGGRDSAFALYFAKEELGLRTLAVHNDNDFETEQAVHNLLSMTEKLGVDYIKRASKAQLSRKIVREKIEMNVHFGNELVVSQICEPCEYGFESAAHNIAKEKNIKLIIWGDSKSESTHSFHTLNRQVMPSRLRKLFSAGIINRVKYHYYFKCLKKEYGRKFYPESRPIHLFDYIPWDRRVIVSTIQERLGWKKPEGSATTWRTDCKLVPLVSFLYAKCYGVSKIELGFSNMIREGKMSRDKAVEELDQMEEAFDIKVLETLLYDMGITKQAVHSILY